MLVGQGLSVLFQAAYFILLGRFLGSTEYGIYVGAVAIVYIVSQYAPLGSHSVFLRYVSVEARLFSIYWGNCLVTTMSLGTILVVLLTWLGPHFAHSYTRSTMFYIAISECLCVQITLGAGRVFQAFEKMRLTALLNLSISFLRTLLVSLLLLDVHHGSASQWALASLVVSAVAASVSVIMVAQLYGKPAFSFTLLQSRAGEGCVFALSYSTTGIYNDVDKAMLGHYGMNSANGIYTMAYRVIDAATMPVISVQGAAFPYFFRKGLEGVRSTALYAIKISKRTSPLTLLSAMVILGIAPYINRLVGPSFSQSAIALCWLCPLPFLRSFQLSAGDALTGAGFQKSRLVSQAAAAAFNIALNIQLIPRYSWRGAAWSSLATDALLAAANWGFLWWLVSSRDPGAPTSSEAG